jgi:1-acyl-sn-glycerol-3-phosphate acyltransferase
MVVTRLLLPLRRLHEYIVLRFGLAFLGIGCLLWTTVAFPLCHVLPRLHGVWLGRKVATLWFRIYLSTLQVIGAARFDLQALDTLREAGPLIIASNHPGLLDALMVISRLPNVVCVFKGSLIKNPLWGAGARLAGYIRNDWFIGSANLAIDELKRGSQLLLFPEGTRSEIAPISKFSVGTAYISHLSGVPIQTVIIEQDTKFLGKGYPIFQRLNMPIHFRIRLGQRFDSPTDPRAFTKVLHDYFLSELCSPPPGI